MNTAQILAVLVLCLGLLVGFWGYRLFKLSLALWGFLLASVGFFYLGLLATKIELLAMILAIIGGVVGAVLCWFFYLGGVFVLGLSAAGGLAGAATGGHPLAMGLAGVLGGLLALWLQRLAIIVASSALGALLAVASVATLFTGLPPAQVLVNDNRLLATVAGSLLTMAGVLVQLRRPTPAPAGPEASADASDDSDDEDGDDARR